ncbi:hypothetical protein Aduo_005137 [Ancylostoma duodenale]
MMVRQAEPPKSIQNQFGTNVVKTNTARADFGRNPAQIAETSESIRIRVVEPKHISKQQPAECCNRRFGKTKAMPHDTWRRSVPRSPQGRPNFASDEQAH